MLPPKAISTKGSLELERIISEKERTGKVYRGNSKKTKTHDQEETGIITIYSFIAVEKRGKSTTLRPRPRATPFPCVLVHCRGEKSGLAQG